MAGDNIFVKICSDCMHFDTKNVSDLEVVCEGETDF